MKTLFICAAAAISVVVVVLHLLSVIFSDKRSVILNFINIALHIALVFAMLLAGAQLELLALVFMTSLLIYTLAFEIKRKMGERGKDK